MKRFSVVIAKDDGGVELYPMKEWLRQHPAQNPSGLDPTSSTSHQLRNALKKAGWSIRETQTEVHLAPPGNVDPIAALNETLGAEDESEEIEQESVGDPTFSLEYQLRDFLAQNLNVIPINGERLSLYVDPAGRDGIEYPTAVGPIDILARDAAGNFFVFELKRARSPDHAIGQLVRYMGWVCQTIGKGMNVNGVIVAKEISEKLRYAIHAVPNVSLFEYEVEFHLKLAHDLRRPS